MRGKLAFLSVITIGWLTWSVHGAEKTSNSYWEWGWGTYGSGSALDVARYDWSLINFGNVPADERTVQRCNEILRLNPKHRFVIRVWPIMGKGDCPENRNQATFLHCLYTPGTLDRVLEETRRQVRLILDGVRTPQNVVGMTFLEELPNHFTSSPFKRGWQEGDPLPWGIKRFEKEIAADLDTPFEMNNPEHRLWWGRKYTEMIAEIHRTMKEAGAERLVLYWQATFYYTLDHDPEGVEKCKRNVVPYSYRDIVTPGLCDGIFGYPNNEKVWDRQTRSIVETMNCRFFSQLSTPAFMRIARFEDTVALARWRNPGNLGAFLYMQGGRSSKAWNRLPYVREDRYWTIADHARRFAWDYKVGLDVVHKALAPEVALDYLAEGKRTGDFVHVWGQVRNPRDASWYGGDADRAVLKDVKLTLHVPDGFEIPAENSAPQTIPLGDIPGRSCMAGDWWVRVTGDGSLPKGQGFRLETVAAQGLPTGTSCLGLAAEIPVLESHAVARSGDTWSEPAYRLPRFEPAVEIVPRKQDIVFRKRLA
ncbi:MAG: hypothetical protein HN904_29015 [Victivallales bacterium]|jgi:hypothetical protein|nr:hypothetical protein [Victivallales bacterium]